MSLLPTFLSAPQDIRPDIFPLVEATSGRAESRERLAMPEIRESSPSPGPTRAPSPTPPQDHRRLSDPALNPIRPGSSASTASSNTLSGTPLVSPGTNNLDTIFGGPLTAEPESTSIVGRRHGAVWLAPSPVACFTAARYTRRDKL